MEESYPTVYALVDLALQKYETLSKAKDELHWYMTQERIEGFVEVSRLERNV